LAGREFGPDDRIFYTQWNPAKLVEAVQRCRVPSLIIPKHQLSPTTKCSCLLCERGGFNESSWWDLNNEMTRGSRTGRLSVNDPLSQRLVRTPPSRVTADRIAAMDPDEYRQYRQFLLMEEMAKADVAKYMTPEQARKILGMEP